MQQTTFQLTSKNYHSKEANQHYMSVSQFKAAIQCEAAMIAELKGEFIRPLSPAMAVGSYLHAGFEGNEAFCTYLQNHHDSIFNMKGNKYADYLKADEMMETVRNDKFCMFALDGEKEVIMTGDLFGAEWKIKVDSIHHQQGTFTDLKSIQAFDKRHWSEKYNAYVSFIQAHDYILQMYVYQEIIFQNTGRYYDPYIVVVTKETPPDKAILHFDSARFGFEEEYVQTMLPSILEAKQGIKKGHRCGKCAYCRANQQL
ncbi:PD-(D/E)XK nuclease-like domain-containing protein [Lysinibacillus piscis]|uniref:Putative exodeoxyribonuclease 8 PDDEXK-like domain-containing protein n=1 Tax=Lysinibacillus piscis TaxID=2518931 RepID=A0ABQ5NIY7_9BACI|nr:PD-(D/E)XK nuclease-like domain-containing protein [Lysinibacillus sp. KH24]GLC88235.1 hypothetical protein LYSBPC_13620 [Lysinibacillus sp. KH24]